MHLDLPELVQSLDLCKADYGAFPVQRVDCIGEVGKQYKGAVLFGFSGYLYYALGQFISFGCVTAVYIGYSDVVHIPAFVFLIIEGCKIGYQVLI